MRDLARRTSWAVVWKGLEVGGNRALSLIRTLILAKLLVPDDFGLLAAGIVTMDVSSQLTNVGIREAVIQQRAPSREQYDTAWTFDLVRTALVAVVLILAAPLIAEYAFGEPRAVSIIRALAFAPVLTRLSSIEVLTLIRQLRFGALAAVGLSGSLVHVVVAIALASSLGVWAMVVGLLAGVTAETVGTYLVAPHVPRFSFRLRAARPLLGFGRGVLLRQIVDVVGGAVLQVVIARRLGTAELGLYFVAARLAFLPREVMRLVGTQVAFPVHAELQLEQARAARAVRSHLLGSWVVLVPLYAIVIALAPSLVAYLVGAQWTGAVPAIQVLAGAAVVGVVANVATPLLLGRGLTTAVALIFALRSLAIVAVVWSLAAQLGLAGACFAWVVAEALGAGLSWWAVRRFLPDAFDAVARPGMATIAAAVVGGAVAAGLDRMIPGIAGLLLAALLALVAALATLWWLDRRLGLGLAREIGRILPSMARWPATSPEKSVAP